MVFGLIKAFMDILGVNKTKRTAAPSKPEIPNYSVLSDFEVKLLEEFNYTEDKFLEEAYKVYVNIQGAWASNDIDKAKEYLSNEMYNQYKAQISTMVLKKQRNVMNSFSYVEGSVTKVRKEEDGLFISTTINVHCIDYLLDENTNTVLRGNANHLWDYVYHLSFELHKDDNKIINNCPNCNAKLKGKAATVKCEYCGSTVVRKAPRVIMVDKKMVYQK